MARSAIAERLALVCLLLSACHADPPPAPVAAAVPPSSSPAPTAPPTAPPSAPDMGFNIVAGTPTVVAEAPIVTPERGGSPHAVRPATAVHSAPSNSGPAPAAHAAPSALMNAQNVIRSHFSEVESCYAPVGLKNPSVAGQVVVQWTLGADGTPTAVAIRDDRLHSSEVTECIRQRARTWRFPAPLGGVAVVSYTYDLKVQ